MRSIRLFGFGALALAALAAGAERAHFQSMRQTTMDRIDPARVVFSPAPIRPEWIIEGHPTAEASEIAHTDDGTTKVYVWKTTAGRFHWFYDCDEVVSILDGEVFVSDGTGPEHRLGPGDVAFFPVGVETTWRVPDHLRKVATLKRPVPDPFASMVRWIRGAKGWLKPSDAFASN